VHDLFRNHRREIMARHAITRGSNHQKALRRLPSGLLIYSPLWMIERRVAFGWERTFHLYDWKRDQMVPVALQDLLTTTNAAAQTYTSRAAWANWLNTVEAIGGGGAGAIGASTATGGGGGGGGAYNRINNFTFATPGTTTTSYFVQAGLLHGGTFPGTAPDTGFGNAVLASSTLLAKGGLSPATSTNATGGTGGLASAGIPTTSPPGRNGGAAGNGASATAGGGGGGAGGPFGVGGAGSGTLGGTADGGKVAGGAAGNPGGHNSGTEFDPAHGCGSGCGGSNASGGTGGSGSLYGGGGGGGSRSTGVGGDGAQGILALSSVVPMFADISTDSAAAVLKMVQAVPYR
jgi:hypothetical protein